MNPCDPAYVVRTGKSIRVSPTDVDDTANIQCAFDWANARGPGMTVRLTPGTFHTAQIYIYDFVGSFRAVVWTRRSSSTCPTSMLGLMSPFMVYHWPIIRNRSW